MGTGSAEDRSDVAVLREVLASVGGRPALAPVHAAASALLTEIDTATGDVEPGDVPDVDVPGLTRPRIDQPLGDPPVGILDAEVVDDGGIGQSTGGVSSGYSAQESPTGYSDEGVPTWDSVRDKIELRTGTALGAEELDHLSPAGRTLDEQWDERQESGRKKLEEIRRSMKDS
ncbi:hypothetical protein [Rhodococcus sp. 1168]|uniref:hypothetical protein n=1 Tax=Rhodococcus sp. 1168 TaxID=2018041 RepID=UPI000A0A3B6B|nr:hypothetical protein [Rhodococcus sp. 1168]ORI13567.1 hypothetical protein BJI47_21245 [Rhodococcus sp. 1168]